MKKWVIKNLPKRHIILHKNNLINDLLLSRGMGNDLEIQEFLSPDLSKLHDPFLLKDMDRAVLRIDEAVIKRQKIVIYGDYDVDGITSTSILFRAFKKLGVDVGYYIPDRMGEGYGINKEAISYIKSLQTDLIITVDCGITSIDEVEYVKNLGMDIIITDHHECQDNIPDTIVINPKRSDCEYPCKSLAGCGIAFKLVQALWIRYNLTGFEDLLDIAAIGTIADIVELKGENRIIAKNGLERIRNSEKCGIKALKQVSELGENVTSYNVAFQIAPRINAVGRLSDAKIAVELFVTNDYDKALQIAKFLDQENKKRQKIEETILLEAIELINNDINLKEDRVIVLSSPKWHIGVIGIVASKLVERFNRPVILICEEKGIGRGSGRSIEGLNLFDILCECSDLFIKFGGHEMAAGLSIEVNQIDKLRERLNKITQDIDPDIFTEKIHAEVTTSPLDINIGTAETLKMFEPFGAGNPSPVLYMEGLSILSSKGLGNREQHLKLNFYKDGLKYDAIYFNGSSEYNKKSWNVVDIMFNLDINVWNNNRNMQLIIKDMRANLDWLKESIIENYYRYIKYMLSDIDLDYNFDKIKFVRRDINFLKNFAYFKRGHILVSSYQLLKDLEFLFDCIEIGGNRNYNDSPQIIVCPNISEIEPGNKEILIYDFLPGISEYKLLAEKSNQNVYNFYDEHTLDNIKEFESLITISDEIVIEFIEKLSHGEVIGTIDIIANKMELNPYTTYRLIILLRESGIIELYIKNDILKLKIKNKNNIEKLNLEKDKIYGEKLMYLGKKLQLVMGEEKL